MTSRLLQVTVDCRNPHRLARFWAAVLDYRVIEDKSDQVEIASWEPTVEAVRREPMPPTVLFIRVPEGKHDEPRTDFGYGTVRWRGLTGVDDSSGVSGCERSWN